MTRTGREPRLPIRRGVTTVGRMAPVTTGNDAPHGTRDSQSDGTRDWERELA